MSPTIAAINGSEKTQKNGSRGATVKTKKPPKKVRKPESLYGGKGTRTPNGNAYEIMAATKAAGTSALIARSHQRDSMSFIVSGAPEWTRSSRDGGSGARGR